MGLRDKIENGGEKLKEGGMAALKRPLITGITLGLVAVQPVAAQSASESIGNALCEAGLDVILQALLFIAVLALILMSFGDIFQALKGQGGDARRRSASGGHVGAAGKKFFGAVILAALPSIFTSMGFNLVGCFGNIAVNIFGG